MQQPVPRFGVLSKVGHVYLEHMMGAVVLRYLPEAGWLLGLGSLWVLAVVYSSQDCFSGGECGSGLAPVTYPDSR